MTIEEFDQPVSKAAVEPIRADRLKRSAGAIAAILEDADLSFHPERFHVMAEESGAERDSARTRADLIARATALGCFDNPNERTDEQLHWAIEAEEASARWLNRFESLPTDEAKSAALRQLAHDFTKGGPGS